MSEFGKLRGIFFLYLNKFYKGLKQYIVKDMAILSEDSQLSTWPHNAFFNSINPLHLHPLTQKWSNVAPLNQNGDVIMPYLMLQNGSQNINGWHRSGPIYYLIYVNGCEHKPNHYNDKCSFESQWCKNQSYCSTKMWKNWYGWDIPCHILTSS